MILEFPGNQDPKPTLPVSKFMLDKTARLLRRYSISYCLDGNRVEYILTARQNTEEISFALVLTRNTFSKQIHVCKFYPGLYRQLNCHYMSAACFFLVVHHFAQQFKLGPDYSIFLQCRQEIFSNFYSTLKDFGFHLIHDGQGENVDIISPYLPAEIDTTMITQRQEICL